MASPRQWFRDALADFKASRTGNNRRANIRADVAALNEATRKWLNDHDADEASLPVQFAADKQGQYNTFVDTLPIADADQTP